jgi:hypothetical protein
MALCWNVSWQGAFPLIWVVRGFAGRCQFGAAVKIRWPANMTSVIGSVLAPRQIWYGASKVVASEVAAQKQQKG